MNLPQFVKVFTSEELFQIRDIVIISNSFYLVVPSLRKVVAQMRDKPFAVGMFLGREEGGNFLPSFQLLDWIMLHTSRKVTLNEKTAWLVICGRDVFRQGILEAPDGLSDGDVVLLQNSVGECLGYGHWCAEKKIAVHILLDRGDFLRRESPHHVKRNK